MNILTNGNEKVKALIFDLPTSVCGITCDKCYAKKAEVRFPNVLKKRNANYESTWHPWFNAMVGEDIQKSKINTVRIHSSGDFYSQNYISKWVNIIRNKPNKMFYAYTKKKHIFNFTEMESLPNMNLIDSLTPLGVNYGNAEYCKQLVDIGYFLCPCSKENKIKCQVECSHCSIKGNDKVAFLQH